MERINILLKITQDSISQENRKKHNEQIVAISKKIEEEFCQKNNQKKNLLNQFIAGTKKSFS